jgi:hypothetical protein
LGEVSELSKSVQYFVAERPPSRRDDVHDDAARDGGALQQAEAGFLHEEARKYRGILAEHVEEVANDEVRAERPRVSRSLGVERARARLAIERGLARLEAPRRGRGTGGRGRSSPGGRPRARRTW